jgi:hypothetical protein
LEIFVRRRDEVDEQVLRVGAHCGDIADDARGGFPADLFGRCVRQKVDSANERVGGEDLVVAAVERQHGAVVADGVEVCSECGYCGVFSDLLECFHAAIES